MPENSIHLQITKLMCWKPGMGGAATATATRNLIMAIRWGGFIRVPNK